MQAFDLHGLWQVLQLAAGIFAVQDPSFPVRPERAIQYAQAARRAGARYGVDPWELVALARHESAFRAALVGPDGKDCGITQTRVTVTPYSCERLRHDVELAFAEGARELRGWSRTCRRHADYDRCRFNRYNAGYRYPTSSWNGGYWLRVKCYEAAAREGARGRECATLRRAKDLRA
jgi:hypothetical protein